MSKDSNAGSESGFAPVGEDVYNYGGVGGGTKRKVDAPVRRIGYVRPLHDGRLFKTYNRLDALGKDKVQYDVSRNDRMSVDEAGIKMEKLVQLYGMLRQSAAVLEAFHNAIFTAHTLNGGSVLQPGRATFVVDGSIFDYYRAVEHLGTDQRRFFRAFANYIRLNNQRILDNSDPTDIAGQELRQSLLQVAANRGMSRFPDLCHDSADACLGLTDAEIAALTASKSMIFATGENMADRNRLRSGNSGSTVVGSQFVQPSAQVALGVRE